MLSIHPEPARMPAMNDLAHSRALGILVVPFPSRRVAGGHEADASVQLSKNALGCEGEVLVRESSVGEKSAPIAETIKGLDDDRIIVQAVARNPAPLTSDVLEELLVELDHAVVASGVVFEARPRSQDDGENQLAGDPWEVPPAVGLALGEAFAQGVLPPCQPPPRSLTIIPPGLVALRAALSNTSALDAMPTWVRAADNKRFDSPSPKPSGRDENSL